MAATNYYLSPLSTFLQVFTDTGIPLGGALLWTYAAGTTTPTNTWTDSTGVVLNSNPIQMASNGRLPNVNVYQIGGVAVKYVFSTNAGTVLVPVFGTQLGPTFDYVYGIDDPSIVLSDLANANTGYGADLVANVIRTYDIAASVRAANVPMPTAGQNIVIYVEGMGSATDGLGGIFIWNATSSATDNGYSVLKPTGESGAGRYLRTTQLFQVQYASKDVATTQATNTTITIDPNLQIPLVVGTYSIEGWINDLGGTSSGGLKGGIYFSGTALDGAWSMNGTGTAVTTVGLTALGTPAELQSAQTGVGSMSLYGMVQVTASGTLSFQWAQQGSNGTASTVSAGSWLRTTLLTGALGVAVSPGSISSIVHSTSQTSAAVTATGVGGTGTYLSYAWTCTGGITVTSASSATTTFSVTGLSPNTPVTGTATVTVKDSSGATATNTVPVFFEDVATPLYSGTMTADYLIVGGQTVGYGYSMYGGSISPTTDTNGNTISQLYTYASNGVVANLFLTLQAASDPTKSYFTNLSISGANYTSASSTYSYSGGSAQWLWNGPGFTPGDMYTVVYN